MNIHIERLTNLNRVMRHVEPDKLDMSNWVTCVVGQARSDPYFVNHFNIEFGKSLNGSPMTYLANYFGLESGQVQSLFLSSGYTGLGREPTPSDMIQKLEVILLQKRAAAPVVEETRDSINELVEAL
jgi:hypothetical protein